MKKIILIVIAVGILSVGKAQTVKDLFSGGGKVCWLGIDFSHVKLIGNFTQFKDAGGANAAEVKEKYFPAWNNLVLNEPKKYDVKKMLRRADMTYEIGKMNDINAKASVKEMEASNNPAYTQEEVEKFTKSYSSGEKIGLGVAFIAEVLNKGTDQGIFNVVVMDMSSKKVLLY